MWIFTPAATSAGSCRSSVVCWDDSNVDAVGGDGVVVGGCIAVVGNVVVFVIMSFSVVISFNGVFAIFVIVLLIFLLLFIESYKLPVLR